MNPPNWIRWLMVYSGQNKFAALDEPKQEIIPIIEYIEYKAIVHNAIRLCFVKLSAFVRCFKYGSEIANDEMHPNKSRIQADGDGLDHRQSVKNLQTYQGNRASMLYTIEESALQH